MAKLDRHQSRSVQPASLASTAEPRSRSRDPQRTNRHVSRSQREDGRQGLRRNSPFAPTRDEWVDPKVLPFVRSDIGGGEHIWSIEMDIWTETSCQPCLNAPSAKRGSFASKGSRR